MKKLVLLLLIILPAHCFCQLKIFAFRYVAAKIEPEPYALKLFDIFVGDSVEVSGYHLGYFRVIKNGKVGFANEVFFKHTLTSDNLRALSKTYDDEINKKDQESLKEAKAREADKKALIAMQLDSQLKEFTSTYGKVATNRAMKGEVWVGMPKELIMFAKLNQKPNSKSKISDTKGTIELWTYDGMEIYILNNKVYKITEFE